MARLVVLVAVGVLLLGLSPVHSSPEKGHYRDARLHDDSRTDLEVGKTYEFEDTFRANQRACVIVEGNHKLVNLTIKILDLSKKLVVAEDTGGDLIAVMWYPPKTQLYRIVISSDATQEDNRLDIVVK